jgi:hypothetical protein
MARRPRANLAPGPLGAVKSREKDRAGRGSFWSAQARIFLDVAWHQQILRRFDMEVGQGYVRRLTDL